MSTLSALRSRARQRADMENSQFVADSEINQYINDAYAELYDLLVSRFEDYFLDEPVDFTITSGSSYSLPSDFYKLAGIDKASFNTDYYALRPFSFANRNNNTNTNKLRGINTDVQYRIVGDKIRFVPEQNAPGSYRIWYIPSYTPLSSDSDAISTVISRNNWDDYIVITAAMKMLAKEESDISVLMMERQKIEARIEEMAQNRDIGDTDRITDVTTLGYDDPYLYR